MGAPLSINFAPTDEPNALTKKFPAVPAIWLGIVILSGFSFLAGGSDRALVGGFASIVATVPLLGLTSTRIRWFHPLILVFIPAVIGTGFRSWYLLYGQGRPGAQRLLIGTQAIDTVLIGSTILGVGLLALVFGFVSFPKRRTSTLKEKPWFEWIASWGWTNVILIASIGFGLIATMLYIRAFGGISLDSLSGKRYIELSSGAVSSGAFYSRAAAVPAFAALPVISRRARGVRMPKTTQVLLVVCLLTSIIAPFIASSRSEIITLLIIVAIA